MKKCYSCSAEWDEKRTPGFRENCNCGVAWHVCANCKFYDSRARDWCNEPAARDEKPRDPEQANMCSWFVFGENGGSSESDERAAKAKAALEALTGGVPPDGKMKDPAGGS